MRLEGLEPPRVAPPAPKAGASTSSATAAAALDCRTAPRLESDSLGALAKLAKAPVSKTGDSRFESWVPRPFARGWLLATLLAVYPANIYMAINPERFDRIPRSLLWARLPVQGLFAWMTWRGTE